jgi:hypothetical protein
MKRRSFLEKLLTKTGRFTDEQITDFIDKLDEEYPDTDAETALALLMTEDEAVGSDKVFGKIKGKAKAEALDPIDNILKTYESKLTAEQKAEYGKLKDDSFKKYQFMLKTFDNDDTKTGDKNYDDLKTDYETLKASLGTDYVKKADHDTLQSTLGSREKEILNVKILNAAIRSGKLRDVSGDRHFERNFVTDAEELLTTGIGEKRIKGFIDTATGKIMRADSPEQPLLIENKAITLSDLADMTITTYGYEKKADQNPTSTVQVPAGGVATAGLTNAQRRMIEQEAAEK